MIFLFNDRNLLLEIRLFLYYLKLSSWYFLFKRLSYERVSCNITREKPVNSQKQSIQMAKETIHCTTRGFWKWKILNEKRLNNEESYMNINFFIQFIYKHYSYVNNIFILFSDAKGQAKLVLKSLNSNNKSIQFTLET